MTKSFTNGSIAVLSLGLLMLVWPARDGGAASEHAGSAGPAEVTGACAAGACGSTSTQDARRLAAPSKATEGRALAPAPLDISPVRLCSVPVLDGRKPVANACDDAH